MQNLRKRPTYNEWINYIELEQPKIKYPDRTATILRNSNYLSQFDGNLLDLEEQEKNIEKEKLKESEIRKIAAKTKTTASLLRIPSSGTQTETYRPTTTTGDAQTDPPLETGTQTERPKTQPASTDTTTAQRFIISQEDKSDTEMEEAEAAMEELREQEERSNQMIAETAKRELR